MEAKKSQKSPKKYECICCHYITCNKKDYNKHILTAKHLRKQNGSTENPQKNSVIYTCEFCEKQYRSRGSYWKHQKTCEYIPPLREELAETSPASIDPNVVVTLIKQNQDFKEIIIEQSRQNQTLQNQLIEVTKGAGNHAGRDYIHNQNNNFNMNFFLNETCKDAMNITDFIQSLKLTLADLEKVGELGYAEGISRMFVNGLNELEVTRRPIHCSDAKREVLHIKDQDKWEKDTPSQDKLKKAIRDLSNRNIMLMDDWRTENPGCDAYDHRKNDIYLRMVVESMGPRDEKKDFGKIIRAVARNTIVHKDAITAIE